MTRVRLRQEECRRHKVHAGVRGRDENIVEYPYLPTAGRTNAATTADVSVLRSDAILRWNDLAL